MSTRQKILGNKAKVMAATIALLSLPGPAAGAEKIPAFPGAEGFGVNEITGGRGGEVRKVTNLNDSGPGSFRAAVAGNEPKIVVFEVGGIIRVKSGLTIGSNTTVAGQTSPSGVTFYNWRREGFPKNNRFDKTAQNGGLGIRGNNVIIRHIRSRGSAFKGRPMSGFAQDVIIDHCSLSWSGDELITFWYGSRNITIQWCTLEESVGFWHGEGGHNYGPMIGSEPGGKVSGNYSLHHTLMAHHKKRNPELQIGPDLATDVRNCVMYDVGGCVGIVCSRKGPWAGKHSVVNNYLKPGPQASWGREYAALRPIGLHFSQRWEKELRKMNKRLEIYCAGNVREDKPGQISGNNEISNWVRDEHLPLGTPVLLDKDPGPPTTTYSAREAYKLVLEKAGAWPRDATTRRTIKEVKQGTGGWVMMPRESIAPRQWKGWAEKNYPRPYTRFYKDDPNDWPKLPAPRDSDNDGMPDEWEKAKRLNRFLADHNGKNLSKEGYTNIEVYINERAESVIGSELKISAR